MAKYKLRKSDFIDVSVNLTSNDPSEIKTIRLYRIEAMQDISRYGVKAGDIGGYVKDEWSLSPKGSAWVGGNAKVLSDPIKGGKAHYCVNDMALITDNATLSGQASLHDETVAKGYALITDEASLWGKSLVSGNAQIFDYAQLHDNAVATDRARVGGMARLKNNSIVSEKTVVQAGAVIGGSAQIKGNAFIGGRAQVGGHLIIENMTLLQSEGVITQNDALYEENDAATQDVAIVKQWANEPWSLPLGKWLDGVYVTANPIGSSSSPLSTKTMVTPAYYSENPTVFTCHADKPIVLDRITIYSNSMTLLRPNRKRPALRIANRPQDHADTVSQVVFTKEGLDGVNCVDDAKKPTHVTMYTLFDPRFVLAQRDIGAVYKLPMSFAPINFNVNAQQVKHLERTARPPLFALEQFKDWHFNEVLKAMASGQNVPYEVLVEYRHRFSQMETLDAQRPVLVDVLLDFSKDNAEHAKLRSIVNDALACRLKVLRPRGLSAADRSRSRLRVVNSPRQIERLNEIVCFFDASSRFLSIDWQASSLASLEVARALSYEDAIGSGQLVSIAVPVKRHTKAKALTMGEICEQFNEAKNRYYAARRAAIG